MPKTISQLPSAASANSSAVVAADNAAGTATEKVTLGQIAALAFSDAPLGGATYGRKDGAWVDLASAAALQFRQGTNADRLAMSPVPASGEPIYTTDGKRLFIGDGVTVGGRGLLGDTDSYILCQPGDDIQGKYAAAKLLTPNGAARSATNRARLVVMPGVYSPGAAHGQVGTSNVGLLVDTDFVDVVCLGSARWRASATLTGSFAGVGITANDVVVIGLGGANFIPGAGGTSRTLENCVGTNFYVCPLLPLVDGSPNVIGGTLIGCRGTTGIGGLTTAVRNVFNGRLVDCENEGFWFRNTLFQGEIVGGRAAMGLTSSSLSFGAFQGRITGAHFPAIASAGLWARSSLAGGSAPAAFTGTCTISQASPAVVTKSSHGLFSGMRIRLSTTGALPTGLNTTTTYYVKVIDSGTFQVATTISGTSINTSSAGSGDHSIVIPPGVEGGRHSFVTTSDGEFTTA